MELRITSNLEITTAIAAVLGVEDLLNSLSLDCTVRELREICKLMPSVFKFYGRVVKKQPGDKKGDGKLRLFKFMREKLAEVKREFMAPDLM